MLAVGSENGERADAGRDGWIHRHDTSIEIAEAVLLSIVTLTAALVGLLGGEVAHRVVARARQGVSDEDCAP